MVATSKATGIFTFELMGDPTGWVDYLNLESPWKLSARKRKEFQGGIPTPYTRKSYPITRRQPGWGDERSKALQLSSILCSFLPFSYQNANQIDIISGLPVRPL